MRLVICHSASSSGLGKRQVGPGASLGQELGGEIFPPADLGGLPGGKPLAGSVRLIFGPVGQQKRQTAAIRRPGAAAASNSPHSWRVNQPAIELPRPAGVMDFEQQLIPAFLELNFNQVIVFDRRPLPPFIQHQLTVYPHLERLVAAGSQDDRGRGGKR